MESGLAAIAAIRNDDVSIAFLDAVRRNSGTPQIRDRYNLGI